MSLIIEEEINKHRKKKSLIKQIWILLVVSLVGIFIMLIFLFILIRSMPGSPYTMSLSEISNQDTISLWGLDKTPFQQFFIFLWNMISGNWGESYFLRKDTPVKEMIVEVFPRFLELNFISFIFSLPLGVIFGIWAFRFEDKLKGQRGKAIKRLNWANFLSFINLPLGVILRIWAFKFKDKLKGQRGKAIKRLNWAILIIGLGSLLQYTFGYKLGLLPSTMFFDANLESIPSITHFRLLDCLIAGDLFAFWDTLLHLVMPVFCQGFIMFSFISELTYSIIDFYKSGKEMPFLSGKIGFYLSFIFTSTLLIDVTFHIPGIAMMLVQSINALDVFVASASIYLIFLTFIVINFSINILLHLIPIVIEFEKKSKTRDTETATINSTESLIGESISDSPETVSEPIVEDNSLTLDNNDENKKSTLRENFRSLNSKIMNPLTILGIIIVFFIVFLAIFTKWISPYDYELITGTDASVEGYLPPSSEHIFGITRYGRDVYSRCLYGIQNAVKMGLISTLIGMPLGVLMGTTSAFFGKWVKYTIDIINGMILFVPGSIFVYSIVSIVGNDFHNFYWIYGLISLPIATLFTQQAISYEMKKGEILPRDFTKSNGRKILNRLPNIILSIIGAGCLVMGLAILFFESLNWLGVGDYCVIGLGTDINIGRSRLTTAPWATFWPAFWIFITVLGFIMLGSGLKEE